LDAKAFYGTVAIATLLGIGGNFIGFDPIKALFWAAVINGIVSIPLMVVMMIMAAAPKVMGRFTVSWPLWTMGWLCTVVMALAVLGMLVTW
jgi:Mn2+/Fe2+ NRAMP family transporter